MITGPMRGLKKYCMGRGQTRKQQTDFATTRPTRPRGPSWWKLRWKNTEICKELFEVTSNILSCPWNAKVTLKCTLETINTVLSIDYSGVHKNSANKGQQSRFCVFLFNCKNRKEEFEIFGITCGVVSSNQFSLSLSHMYISFLHVFIPFLHV